MLINFIGTFNSGKTTLASKVFASLKESGYSVEFVPEQARLYIATLRLEQNLKPEDHIELFNKDQLEILSDQYYAESLMLKACGPKTIVVTDSSVWNTLLYMEDAYIEHFAKHWLTDIVSFYKTQQVVTFLCPSVPIINNNDPNRIHSAKDLDLLNNRLDKLFGSYNIPKVSGLPSERLYQVLFHLHGNNLISKGSN